MATIGEMRAQLAPLIVALRRNAVDGRIESARQVMAAAIKMDIGDSRLRRYSEMLHDLGFLRIPPGKTFGYVNMSRMLQDSELNLVSVPRAKRQVQTAFTQEQERLRVAAATLKGEVLVWAELQLTLGSQWVLSVEGQELRFQIVGDVEKRPNRPNAPAKVLIQPGLGVEEAHGFFVRKDGAKLRKLSIVAMFAHCQEGQLRRVGR